MLFSNKEQAKTTFKYLFSKIYHIYTQQQFLFWLTRSNCNISIRQTFNLCQKEEMILNNLWVLMTATHQGTRGCRARWNRPPQHSFGHLERTYTAEICSIPPRQKQERRRRWRVSGSSCCLGQCGRSSGRGRPFWRRWLASTHKADLRMKRRGITTILFFRYVASNCLPKRMQVLWYLVWF